MINRSELETLILWWHFDIAMIRFQSSYSIFSNGSGKPTPCIYGTWCLLVTFFAIYVSSLFFNRLVDCVFCYFINILLKKNIWKILTIKFCFILIHNICHFILGINNTYLSSSFLLICCYFWSSSFISWLIIWIRYRIISGDRCRYVILSGNRWIYGILSGNRCSYR